MRCFPEKFTAGIFSHDCWSRQISTLNRIFPNFKSTTFHLYSRAKDGLESWKLGVVRLVALPAGCLSRQVASLFSSNASSRPQWWNEVHLHHLQLIILIIISRHFHQTYHHHINIIMTIMMMVVVHWFELIVSRFKVFWERFLLIIYHTLNITTQDCQTSNQQISGTAQIVFSTQGGTQQKKGLQRKFVNILQFLMFSFGNVSETKIHS